MVCVGQHLLNVPSTVKNEGERTRQSRTPRRDARDNVHCRPSQSEHGLTDIKRVGEGVAATAGRGGGRHKVSELLEHRLASSDSLECVQGLFSVFDKCSEVTMNEWLHLPIRRHPLGEEGAEEATLHLIDVEGLPHALYVHQ